MMIRKEKGLCYTYDAKFTPTHKCPNRQYMLIECQEDDGNEERVEDGDETNENTEQEELIVHHLSLHAYLESPGKATI